MHSDESCPKQLFSRPHLVWRRNHKYSSPYSNCSSKLQSPAGSCWPWTTRSKSQPNQAFFLFFLPLSLSCLYITRLVLMLINTAFLRRESLFIALKYRKDEKIYKQVVLRNNGLRLQQFQGNSACWGELSKGCVQSKIR